MAAAYDPYGYEGYDYDDYGEYDYEDDYYGAYSYAAPVLYPTIRRRARGRVLPLRGVRSVTPLSLVRGGARGAARLGMTRGAATARGWGLAPRGQLRGLKRKTADSASGFPETKRLMQMDAWETQPIVQQPLSSAEDEWYQDSWA